MVNVKVLEEQLNFPTIGRSSVLEQVMPGDVRCCAYQPIAYIKRRQLDYLHPKKIYYILLIFICFIVDNLQWYFFITMFLTFQFVVESSQLHTIAYKEYIMRLPQHQ